MGVPVHHTQTLSDRKPSRGGHENGTHDLVRHYFVYHVFGLSTVPSLRHSRVPEDPHVIGRESG